MVTTIPLHRCRRAICWCPGSAPYPEPCWPLSWVLACRLSPVRQSYYRLMHKYTREIKESESQITFHGGGEPANQPVIRTFERQESELGRLQDLQSRLHGSVDKRTGVSVVANLIMGVAFNGATSPPSCGRVRLGEGNRHLWRHDGIHTAGGEDSASPVRPDAAASHPYYAKASIERLIYLTGFAKEESGVHPLQGNVTLHVDRLTLHAGGMTSPYCMSFP